MCVAVGGFRGGGALLARQQEHGGLPGEHTGGRAGGAAGLGRLFRVHVWMVSVGLLVLETCWWPSRCLCYYSLLFT